MNEPLRIAVADDEPLMLRYYEETLAKLGHRVVVSATNGKDLVDQCADTTPDLLITDIKMPELDGIDAASAIRRQRELPIILVSAFPDPEYIQRALDDRVLAYLVKPIKQSDLQTAIALVMRRFQEFQALKQQADDLSQALENRKVIERAKGILMERAGLDEADAFRRLQKLARDKNQKLVVVARAILTAEDAFGRE